MFVETKPDGESQTKSKWRMSLLKAAALIEERGWCQGKLRDVNGEHCLYGAIWLSHYGVEPRTGDSANREWMEVFTIMEKQVGQDAAIWNDAPERTAREVVAALRAAAASC